MELFNKIHQKALICIKCEHFSDYKIKTYEYFTTTQVYRFRWLPMDHQNVIVVVKWTKSVSNFIRDFFFKIPCWKCLVTNVNCKESKNSYLQSCSVRLSFSVQYKVVHHDLSSWDCNHIKVLHLTLKPIHSFESMKTGNISLCFHVIRVGLSAEFYIFT